MVEHLVPNWWNSLGRVRGSGLVAGGVLVGDVGFEIPKAAQDIPSLPHAC